MVALAVRLTGEDPPTALLAVGAILLAPPLVLLGYWFLRDDELDGYHGKELIVRTAILSAIFIVTWGIYATIPTYVGSYKSLAEIDMLSVALVVPVMIGLGAFASVLTMELEGLQGLLHYLLYFAVTLILALIMGTQLAQPFARDTAKKNTPPAATTPTPPTTPGTKAAPPPPPVTDPNAKKPKLMQ